MKKIESGFTLIEIVVVIAIVLVCSVVLVDLFIGQNRLYRTQTAELNVTSDARRALDDIDASVRQASSTVSDYLTYTAGAQTLILQIQSVNSSDQLVPGSYDYVVYYIAGTDLFIQSFPDALSARPAIMKKLASNVTGLVFTLNSYDFAQVSEVSTDITLQEFAGIQVRSITLSSKSKLRNY